MNWLERLQATAIFVCGVALSAVPFLPLPVGAQGLIIRKAAAAARAGTNPTTTDLLLWLSMDEGSSGVVADAHSTNEFAFGADVPTWVGSGKVGADSIRFATTDDLASDAAITFGSPVITVCFWLKVTDATPPAAEIIAESSTNYNSQPASWIAYLDPNGKIYLGIKGFTGYRMGTVTMPDTNWHFWCFVYDYDAGSGSGDIKVYLDGTLQSATVTTNNKTGTGDFAAHVLYLGSRAESSIGLNGDMDEFAIFTRELTADEVTWLYNDATGSAYGDL